MWTGTTGVPVRAAISPIPGSAWFNFPSMVPNWTIPNAIALGNCMIIKPSEKVPISCGRIAELLKEAGLPDGVFNIVHGDTEIVEAICDHPSIEAVSFVGELYNASYELTNSPEVSLSLKNNEGKKYDFSMSREGKGYQLNAGILPVGNYVFTAKTTYNGKEMTAEGQFTVKALQLEFINLTADHNILKAMSTESNGQFFEYKELNQIKEALKKSVTLKPLLVTEKKTQTLLSMPFLLILLMVSLSLEWGIRRFIGIY